MYRVRSKPVCLFVKASVFIQARRQQLTMTFCHFPVNYGFIMFYSKCHTGLSVKHYGLVIYRKWADFIVSQCLFYCKSQTHQLVTESEHYESVMFFSAVTCGLFYKHMMIVNDDYSIISEQNFQLIDDARGAIYDRRMFIIQATGCRFRKLLRYDYFITFQKFGIQK